MNFNNFGSLERLIVGVGHHYKTPQEQLASDKESVEQRIQRTWLPDMEKRGYVAHLKGHKNSKGQDAPWVVKSHETGEVLSSHSTKEEAEKHLVDMKIHKKSGAINMDFTKIGSLDELLKQADLMMEPDTSGFPSKPKKRYSIDWWAERDRASVVVTDNETGKDIFEAWDEDAVQLIEDGFIKWKNDASVLEYCKHLGIIE